MQLLASSTKNGAADHACAKAMLAGLPSVVWFIRRELRRRREHGLSVPQFRALGHLDLFEKLTLSCIADNLGCSLPTASRMIESMVAKGLVGRCVCSEDRRQVSLVITAKGRAVLNASRRGTEAVLVEKLAHLPAAQKQEITEAMRTLLRVFGAEAANGEAGRKSASIRVSAPRRGATFVKGV